MILRKIFHFYNLECYANTTLFIKFGMLVVHNCHDINISEVKRVKRYYINIINNLKGVLYVLFKESFKK